MSGRGVAIAVVLACAALAAWCAAMAVVAPPPPRHTAPMGVRVGSWVDPSDVSGCASDDNDCTPTCGAHGHGPCRSWRAGAYVLPRPMRAADLDAPGAARTFGCMSSGGHTWCCDQEGTCAK